MRIHILVPRQKKIPSLKKKKRERETWRRCDENVGIGEGNKGKEGWHEPWFLGPVSCSGQISGLKIPERRRCIENLGKSHTCTQTTEGANQTGERCVRPDCGLRTRREMDIDADIPEDKWHEGSALLRCSRGGHFLSFQFHWDTTDIQHYMTLR